MTYNVFRGTLNPTQSINQSTATGHDRNEKSNVGRKTRQTRGRRQHCRSQVLRDGDRHWRGSTVTASLQQTGRRPAESRPIYHVRVLHGRESSASECCRLTIVADRVVSPLAAMTPRPPRLSANRRPRRQRNRKYSGGRSTSTWVFPDVILGPGVRRGRLPRNLAYDGELRRAVGGSVDWATASG